MEWTILVVFCLAVSTLQSHAHLSTISRITLQQNLYIHNYVNIGLSIIIEPAIQPYIAGNGLRVTDIVQRSPFLLGCTI